MRALLAKSNLHQLESVSCFMPILYKIILPITMCILHKFYLFLFPFYQQDA